jgi:pimeloyl-ACP methyl ester carboxylesterase
MTTLILPGFSPHNQEWAESIKSSLNLGHEIIVHHWRHWTKGGGLALKYELAKIQAEIAGEKINIIAKSVGTYVAAKIVATNPAQIGKIILCGIPSTSDVRENIYKQVFADFPAKKIICFQNEKDPFASFEEVKKFMWGINPQMAVIKKERSDHQYPYPQDFQDFLKN